MRMGCRVGIGMQRLFVGWLVFSDFIKVAVERPVASTTSNIAHALSHCWQGLLPSGQTQGEVDQLLLETHHSPSLCVLPNAEGSKFGKASLNHLHVVGRGVFRVTWVSWVFRILRIGTIRP